MALWIEWPPCYPDVGGLNHGTDNLNSWLAEESPCTFFLNFPSMSVCKWKNSVVQLSIIYNETLCTPLTQVLKQRRRATRARHNNKPALKQRGSQLAPSTFLSIFSHNLDIEMENQTCLNDERQEDYFWKKMAFDPVLHKMVYLQISSKTIIHIKYLQELTFSWGFLLFWQKPSKKT